MRIVAFLGPTLRAEEATALCGCEVRPPVRRGDVATLMAEPPDVIAIVDGYFEQVPSVWHKEILYALACGVKVAGAASMGALRAAELAPFGMVGVGAVFAAYERGRFDPFTDPFEDDDEVAVVHGPEDLGYLASDALVDMRASFAVAARAGVISQDTAQDLIDVAKSIYYKNRTYDAVLEQANSVLPAPTRADLAPLREWLYEHKVRQKRADAIALFNGLAEGALRFETPAFRFEPTLLWDRWSREGAPEPQ